MRSIAGLILAAGESRRMGEPKALLDFGGETFLDRLIRLMSPSCSPIIVVLGHEAQRIRSGLKQAGKAEFVVNENYLRGQLSSLQRGLAGIPSGVEGVLFTLVDRPGVQPSTVEAILDRFEQRSAGEKIVVPRAGGQNGHPVCVARELIPEFLALPLGAQARDVIRSHADATAYVDVEDTGILLDVNDPETYQRLVAGGERCTVAVESTKGS